MTPEAQHELLARGTEEILPEGELVRRLREREREIRPLRVKQGFDPTAPDIHLGHTVGLRKLRQFQDLGHQVVLIIGDYTGLVGDPSGRSKTRPRLTPAEIESNSTTYLDQFFRVLEKNPSPPLLPVEIRRNGEWFARMSFAELLELASQYTVARLLERDDFAKRMAAQQPVGVHELLYPLMQGHDSVEIRADVEIGATEQKFNLLVGRVLQELHGQSPQIAMTLPVLVGTDGVQRMGKSLGNYIGVTDPPGEMYGKVMSLPDRVMSDYWRLVTDAAPAELEDVERALADASQNPMEIKQKLATRIVRMYHGEAAAGRAARDFDAQFRRRDVPQDLAVCVVPAGEIGIKDLLVQAGLAASGSAAWRAVDQGAVSIDGVRIT
ncbi:MAG: tyrosine--tRNA ligase, partial [Candidatus Eisenbacteria bacterium]